jgi:hypothetical protein
MILERARGEKVLFLELFGGSGSPRAAVERPGPYRTSTQTSSPLLSRQ